MTETRDWRNAYQGQMRQRVDQLRQARARGETRFQVGAAVGTVDPTKLTDRMIEDIARRDAETVVNRSINRYLERERAGRLKSNG